MKCNARFIAAPALLAGMLLAALLCPALTSQAQTVQNPGTALAPAPPPGEIWVYPTGVFPDDFYALWLAVNGAPYAVGDLPYPYWSLPDTQPAARPVFIGKALPGGKWTIVLKARRLEAGGEGASIEGDYTAFNLGLAAGTQLTKSDPVPPVDYLLTTDSDRFSTGFGVLLLQRSVAVRGELIACGEEGFFGYTPNFDPALNPDTNPSFNATWLPAGYLRGSEFKTGQGYGIRSLKSVIYGGNMAFFIATVNANLSLSDCLLYGQYGSGVVDYTGPNDVRVQNVDICHTYHCHQLGSKNNVGMLTWAINFQNVFGGGGRKYIEGCFIDQSPTWQEYYFGANPGRHRYYVGSFPGSHAITIYDQAKGSPDDSVRIKRSTLKNCGSNVIVYQTSDVDLSVENCAIDGGYFPILPSKGSPFADWRGNCIIVLVPWGTPPAIEIRDSELTARGLDAWGLRVLGCPNGEVTASDNTIVCKAARPGYAGGILLEQGWARPCNDNTFLGTTIRGTGSWAIMIDTIYYPCERNRFLNTDLADFSTQEAGAVFFGPYANYNLFSGDPGAGIVDQGTGNVVE